MPEDSINYKSETQFNSMMQTAAAPSDYAMDMYGNVNNITCASTQGYLNVVKQNPIHYSKTTFNLTQLMYADPNNVTGMLYSGNNPAAAIEDNTLRRQYYHHRHHVHEENLKNKTRFSGTALPSTCSNSVVRDSKLSFTPPSSPTVGSGMTSFSNTSGVYYASSSSGCYSKTSYSSCSSTNSISPRKRRADEDGVLHRRQGCRSSNSSGVGSCCSCDKCLSIDTSYQSDASQDPTIVPSGKRSKNDTEDDDVVFISETPGYGSWNSSSTGNPYSQRPKTIKGNKKNRKAAKKPIAHSKVSPFAVPFSIPNVAIKSKPSGYFLRSSAKEQIGSESVTKVISAPVYDQRQSSSSTTSVENSIQKLAINISTETNNPSCTFNIQTRSKAGKKDAVTTPVQAQQQITTSNQVPNANVEPSIKKSENTVHQLNDQMQSSRHRDARSSANFRKTYDIHGVIGVGGGGTVYAGTRKSDNIQVAVKEVPKNKVKRWGKLDGRVVPIEFDLLHRASNTGHKGIIQMLDWFERRKSFILVMERPQPVIDLFDYLNQNGALTESAARKIFLQIADSVLHCHANGVVHRDIKDENVLLNLHTQEAKLIDFGCGTVLKDAPYTEFAGTPEFYPPEWFTQKKYNGERVDAWSLGVLLFTMLEAEVPFSTEQKIVACQLSYKHPEKLSDSSKHLLSWMLQKDEQTRPTLVQALQHPWFKDAIRSSKINAGVMATKDLFASQKIQPLVTRPNGHMVATTDSPMSPQHNGNFNFQVIPHRT